MLTDAAELCRPVRTRELQNSLISRYQSPRNFRSQDRNLSWTPIYCCYLGLHESSHTLSYPYCFSRQRSQSLTPWNLKYPFFFGHLIPYHLLIKICFSFHFTFILYLKQVSSKVRQWCKIMENNMLKVITPIVPNVVSQRLWISSLGNMALYKYAY